MKTASKHDVDLLDIPAPFRRKAGKKGRSSDGAVKTAAPSADTFFDTAALEPLELVPGQMAYVWLFTAPGGTDKTEWPVSGWAPYLIWRWTDKHIELWHASTLTRLRISRRHPALDDPRHVPRDEMTPARVADRFRRSVATYDRCGRWYLQGVPGVIGYLEKLKDFSTAETPAPGTVDGYGGYTEGDDDMAAKGKAKKTETSEKKSGSGRKPGSGAWIREELLKMHNGKGKKRTDEELAAEAREKFGGKTGTSDIAWNRGKLRKEGHLPPTERKQKKAA